ncbi:HTH-type transcriptional activator IlvY [Nitrincola iocasae]|uniref:HTH-type transcriptional activator IlvY n=1 Tax=Nitrincola iocasae TaxID=2614693 RepID=A0A5J6LA69_9GAMM|nr:HTH-type transcriptional activator IlvY [Nitrincola iocasae]QEW05407.1 HTH-type transcriptional activator IlvY [Nitrincola iocasae]
MDSKSLQHFLMLADTLHFSRASAACHISPSTLSRTIKQLEDELGVSLFIRDNRSVSLTAEGRRLQTYARETLQQWQTLRSTLQADQQELQGELSMYCSVTASYSFLYEILSRFRQDYPRIEIKLHTGDPAEAIQRVQNGTEDIAIGARPDHLPQDIAFRSITRSPLVFITPADQPDLQQRLSGVASKANWQDVPMILSEAGLARKRSDHWFRSLGIKPLIYAQVSGNEAIVSMVSLGFGVGLVPQIVLDNSPLASRVTALKVSPELTPFEVGIFALENKLRHPLIHAFWTQHEKRPQKD